MHPKANDIANLALANTALPQADVGPRFASLSIHGKDRIRLANFPWEDVWALMQLTRANWQEGITFTHAFNLCHEIKFKGKPWAHNGVGLDGPRVLMLRILEKLYNRGWVLQVSIDFIHEASDRDSLLFRRQEAMPAPCRWLCVSFDRWNKLKIVEDPPLDLCHAIYAGFDGEIQERDTTGARLKVKFRGTPWEPTGTEGVGSRMKMIKLLRILEQYGFTPYSAINIHKGHSRDGQDADILIVTRPWNWIHDLPVWRR